MKLFEKTQVIVYRVEESLNLYDGKKKLDKVVSGRILKSTTKLFGFGKTKYKYEVNIPMFDKEDAQTKERLQEVLQSVVQKCEAKIKEWRKMNAYIQSKRMKVSIGGEYDEIKGCRGEKYLKIR